MISKIAARKAELHITASMYLSSRKALLL
jgi:hypothetical protein